MDAIAGGRGRRWWPGAHADAAGGASRRRRRSARPTPTARRASCTAPASPWAAWPRAPRCWPRTWRRCSPCSPPTPQVDARRAHRRSCGPGWRRASTPCRRTGARRPTTPSSSWHRALAGPPADPTGVRGRRGRGLPRPGHADGRRRRGPHQGRHGEGHRRHVRRRGPGRCPQGGREPAREVLVVRQGPLLGPGRERARQRGHRVRGRQAERPLRRPPRGRARRHGGRRPGRGRRLHGPGRSSRSPPTSGSGTAPPASSPTTSPTPTSTRTWGPRERSHRPPRRGPTCWSRRFPTSSASAAARSS